MKSCETVITALKSEPVVRVPVFMWFHPEMEHHLSCLLEILVAQVGKAMVNDISQTWVNHNYAMEGITHEKDGKFHIDDLGD